MDDAIHYVAGFLFLNWDSSNNAVALIRKSKPQWQAGRLNAIGGKVEPGETPEAAMQREFLEEAGLNITSWEKFAYLEGVAWDCHFYRAVGPIQDCQSLTEEQVEIYYLDDFYKFTEKDCISNLKWLLPLALNKDRGVSFPVVVHYDK